MPTRHPKRKAAAPKATAPKPAPKASVKRKGAAGRRGSSMAAAILTTAMPRTEGKPGFMNLTGHQPQDQNLPSPIVLGEDDPATPPLTDKAPIPHRWRKKR